MSGAPDDCPVLADTLSEGGEVHLPEGRSPAASTIARFASHVGLGAALAFATPSGTAMADSLAEVSASPLPGFPVMAAPDISALPPPPAPPAPAPAIETWSLRGTIDDDRIELSGTGGKVKVRRDLAQVILDAATETEVDPQIMMAMADKESSFDPRAKSNSSTAVGLYQFLESTWLEMVKRAGARHGLAREAASITYDARRRPQVADPAERARILKLREDPRTSALLACELYKMQDRGLSNRIGTKPTAAENYMAHMLGMAGASRFIVAKREKPDAIAKRLFPAEAESNKAIFHEGRRPRTMSQVHQVVTRQIDTRLSIYSDIADKLFAPATGPRR